MEVKKIIDTKPQEQQRMVDVADEEMWSPWLESINELMLQEKKARQDNDSFKGSEICCKILQSAFDEKEYARVREWLLVLSKRRAQSKKATTDMVQLCMNTFKAQLPSREDRFNMLTTLRTATEGKIFLEREYAQTTKEVVEMYEADGKIDEAAKIIQEIQIETYGSLENKEKVDFILYQMKLVLARQDYIRTQILSRKISKRAIGEKGLEQQKITYYGFMVRYFVHEKETLETAKCYQTIFDTINKCEDEEQKKQLDPEGSLGTSAFQNFVLYLLISPYTNEKVDMLNICESLYPREMEKEELLAKYVRKFLTFELMPLQEDSITDQMTGFEPFCERTLHHKNHLIELVRQLVQHNLRVIEKYYSRVSLARMSQLVGVSVERTENELGDMVVNGRIGAKINRLVGIVTFNKRKQFTNERLNSWNFDLKTTLDKIEQTCHLIDREKVIHQ